MTSTDTRTLRAVSECVDPRNGSEMPAEVSEQFDEVYLAALIYRASAAIPKLYHVAIHSLASFDIKRTPATL
jgi:hypothetical protein